jgi:uncharacterized RDD family membrane protein YckC
VLKREIVGRPLLNVVFGGVFTLIDAAVAMCSSDRRALHDRIGGTIVVRA